MSIVLPSALVHPFDLRYVADDVHVIAYFSGHPQYECVEAMLSVRDDGTFAVRAILTQHDQTQIDLVNDDTLLAMAAHDVRRTTVRCEIDVTLDVAARLPFAEVRLRSPAGEPVVLRVACASPPDVARGGLTDPGDHALDSSLPIMLRMASAMAAPSSSVHIAGVAYAIPEKLRAGPHFVAHDGYFTRGFHMAALRNARRTLRVVRQPAVLAAGERWEYESPQGDRAYEIVSRDTDGHLQIISTSGPQESVHAFATTDGTLRLTEVVLHSPRHRGQGLAVRFAADGAFAIHIDAQAAISGTAQTSGVNALMLHPDRPAWAARRPLHVRWQHAGAELTIESSRAAS
ncbi:MAG: hypothetical protein U1E89_05270 [Burkholderiaceae bacterium]